MSKRSFGGWDWTLVGAVALLGGGAVIWFLKPEWFGRAPALLPSWFPGSPAPEEAAEPAAAPTFNFGASKMATGYRNGQPFSLELVTVEGGHALAAAPAAAFLAMRAAALAEGVVLSVTTAFRDMAYQQTLYARYVAGTGSLAAKPGYSNHQAGTALDLATARGTNTAYHWLVKNAARFGWKRTVSSEPWHWEWFAQNIA